MKNNVTNINIDRLFLDIPDWQIRLENSLIAAQQQDDKPDSIDGLLTPDKSSINWPYKININDSAYVRMYKNLKNLQFAASKTLAGHLIMPLSAEEVLEGMNSFILRIINGEDISI